MANNYKFENRDERIERMARDNPGRPIELCTAVVDGIWDKKKELINSRIPERFANASMDDLGYLRKGIELAVQKMIESPDKNDKVGVIFCGPSGTGKTHAAYAVIKAISDKNPEMIAFTTTYADAFSALKNEFTHDGVDELGSMWDKLCNISGMYDGVLLLDDVSAQHLTEFEIDKLLMFLERRFNSYMPFILTTNVKEEDFKKVFGERLASRLSGYCSVVEFNESDKRLETTNGE